MLIHCGGLKNQLCSWELWLLQALSQTWAAPGPLGGLSWEQGPPLKRKGFPRFPCKCWLQAACFGVCEAEIKLSCHYEIFGVTIDIFYSL